MTEAEFEAAWRRLRNAMNRKGQPNSNDDFRYLARCCLGLDQIPGKELYSTPPAT